MNTHEFITVIIPTHNRKNILGKCLDALSKQSYPQNQYEIIVIDDGSTDGTAEHLKDVSQRISSLRYFSQKQGGPARARNLGIENAKGPLILFAGDDCIADKNLLQEHAKAHKDHKAIAVLGHIDWHPDLEVTPFMRYISLDTQFSYPKIREQPENVPFGYFYTSNISIPLEYLKKAGGFDKDFTGAAFEDVELGYRIWKSGVRIIYNPRAITCHYHAIDLKSYIARQISAGQAASILYKKHPELVDYLRLPKVTSSEARFRFYQGVLDYCYLIGLQQGLESPENSESLLPLEDRLKNWSNAEIGSLTKRLLSLECQLQDRDDRIAKAKHDIDHLQTSITREIDKRDKLIEELNKKNQEKYYKIVELEKFADRVKSTIPYKAYALVRKIFGK